MADLPRSPALADDRIPRDRAEALLVGWGHPRPVAWLDGKLDAGAISAGGSTAATTAIGWPGSPPCS